MIWVVWRQFRTQALVTLGLLAVFSGLVLVTGLHLRDVYDSLGGARCSARNDCAALLGRDKALAALLGPALLAIPALLGMFWGAPLVARELESGTYRLAWTQSVTRRRWLSIRVALVGVAALAVAGLASWLVSWWFAPLDAVNLNRFDPSVFTARGVVAVGYAGFAFALGVAMGNVLRRTLPAMAATLLGFVAARIVITLWVRPHLLASRRILSSLTLGQSVGFRGTPASVSVSASTPRIPNAWAISAALVDRVHHALSAAQLHALLVRSCPTLAAGLPQNPGAGATKSPGGLEGGVFSACLHALSQHLQLLVTDQPPSHYWPLQALETGVFLAAAVALIGVTVWRVGRRAARMTAAGEPQERTANRLALEVAGETGVRARGHQRENEMKGTSMDRAERRLADRRPHRTLRWFAAALVTAGVLVSGCGGSASTTLSSQARQKTQASPSGPSATATGDCDSLTSCYTPRQLERAYGIQPLLAQGIDGRGETVVLPEIAEGLFPRSSYSDLRADMARFDQLFGLPAPRLRMTNSLARAGSPWSADGEEVLDAEMVHAAAPGAAITIVLITPSSFHSAKSGVVAAVAALRLGVREGAVISISAAGQTGGEHCDTPSEVKVLDSALVDAADRRVTVVAASGDVGTVGEPCDLAEGLLGGSFPPVREVNLPASDPLVLAAGGTTLTASHTTGRYIGETGWGLPYGMAGSQFQASGGGFSHLFARPSYQSGISAAGTGRGVPDIASDAAPHTGMALVISTGGDRYTIRNSGGTSAAAPLWAGVIALADQSAHRHLGFVNAVVYRIARTSNNAFHQITTGNNSVSFPPHTIIGYHAGRGWNPVTGWGSPNASVLVPLLARYTRS
jgi:hypothetical protein